MKCGTIWQGRFNCYLVRKQRSKLETLPIVIIFQNKPAKKSFMFNVKMNSLLLQFIFKSSKSY